MSVGNVSVGGRRGMVPTAASGRILFSMGPGAALRVLTGNFGDVPGQLPASMRPSDRGSRFTRTIRRRKGYTHVGNAMNLSAEEAASDVEEDGFPVFFTAHYGDVARAMYLLTRDPAEADDLAQEAMTRLYERWGRVRRMDSPGGYLYRTALNLHRKRARRLAVAAAVHLPGAREAADPAQIVENRSEILRLLGSLTVAQQHVVVLVEWLGLESDEAASVLGIKAASVRTRLHRARETLRSAIGEGS